MKALHKVQLVKAIQNFTFWVPTIVLYYQAQGYTDSQIFTLLGFAQIFVVILEYPTGVIGDYFGHKLSVQLGYVFWFLATLLLGSSLSIPYNLAIVYLLLFASGTAFVSGSDIALLSSVSDDFKRDNATSAQLGGVFQLFGFIVGGFVATFDLRFPFILSSIGFVIAFLILQSVNIGKVKVEQKDIFTLAKEGIKESLKGDKLYFPMFVSSAVIMYLLSEKFIITPVFQRINLPIYAYGIGTAVIFFISSQFSGLYKKYKNIKLLYLILGITLSSLLISFNYINIVGLILAYCFGRYINTQLDAEINEKIRDGLRATVFSFRNLLSRLLNAFYLWIISFVSLRYSFEVQNFAMTGILLTIIAIIYMYRYIREKNASPDI